MIERYRYMESTMTGEAIERQTLNLWPETGKLLGLGKNAIYAAAKNGDIRVLKIGKRLLVTKVEINRLLSGEKAAA